MRFELRYRVLYTYIIDCFSNKAPPNYHRGPPSYRSRRIVRVPSGRVWDHFQRRIAGHSGSVRALRADHAHHPGRHHRFRDRADGHRLLRHPALRIEGDRTRHHRPRDRGDRAGALRGRLQRGRGLLAPRPDSDVHHRPLLPVSQVRQDRTGQGLLAVPRHPRHRLHLVPRRDPDVVRRLGGGERLPYRRQERHTGRKSLVPHPVPIPVGDTHIQGLGHRADARQHDRRHDRIDRRLFLLRSR